MYAQSHVEKFRLPVICQKIVEWMVKVCTYEGVDATWATRCIEARIEREKVDGKRPQVDDNKTQSDRIQKDMI